MRLHYYAETDSLYIELRDGASVATSELAEGVNADFGEDGQVVGFDIDQALQRVDPACLEAVGLPFQCG